VHRFQLFPFLGDFLQTATALKVGNSVNGQILSTIGHHGEERPLTLTTVIDGL